MNFAEREDFWMDEEFKEGIKKAMAEPAKDRMILRPLYSHKAQDTTPVGRSRERRLRKWRRYWYNLAEDFGLLIWIVVGVLAGAIVWMVLAGILGWLRAL